VALIIAPADGATPGLLQSSLDRLLLQRKLVAPVLLREDSVLVFVPATESPTAPHLLLDALQQNHAVTAGVSAIAPTAAQWARALDEAEQALALGRQLFGEHSTTAFADLGVYRLLLALRDSPELWRYRDTLGPLLDHGPSSADLLETIEGYFLARGNVSRAAALLHIHRNTLIYRLQRISEIANIDWERSEDQLALQLALKAHRVLRMVEATAERA
jgi:purine catabolism regulator